MPTGLHKLGTNYSREHGRQEPVSEEQTARGGGGKTDQTITVGGGQPARARAGPTGACRREDPSARAGRTPVQSSGSS